MKMARYRSFRQEFNRSFNNEVERTLEAIGAYASSNAKALAPVDDGNLRSSINHRVDVAKRKVTIGASANYSAYVEFGTGRYAERGGRQTPWYYYNEKLGRVVKTEGMQPQPYLRPAVLDNISAINAIIRRFNPR